jgi:hypothetical protein
MPYLPGFGPGRVAKTIFPGIFPSTREVPQVFGLKGAIVPILRLIRQMYRKERITFGM